MNVKLFTFILLSFFSFSAYSQTSHIVQLIGTSFQPAQSTIQVGDTVIWENNSGILHNVVADDNSFTSGAPSSDHWIYKHVFSTLGTYQYYCQIHGAPGGVGMSGKIIVQGTTGVTDNNNPLSYRLAQNYPNPFNPATSINITIEKTNFTQLTIYNTIGEQVANLVSRTLNPGSYTFTWNAANVPSGVYFYRLVSGNFTDVKKMTLLK